MHAGDRLVVSVNPALKSGAPCRMCTVKWTTASPSTAEWSSFATSGTGHLATLTALSPGQVRLVVEVCPGVYFKCQQTTFASRSSSSGTPEIAPVRITKFGSRRR